MTSGEWSNIGPATLVSRVPWINQYIWRHDIDAVYKLALMYYFTRNGAYAAKATAIIDRMAYDDDYLWR